MNEDKSTRYQRLQRRVSMASWAWSLGLLMVLAGSGLATALRDGVTALPGGDRSAVAVTYYVLALTLMHEIGALSFGSYGFILERRYGLSRQRFPCWFGDQAKALALTVVAASAAANLVYGSISLAAGWWWVVAGSSIAALSAMIASVAPVLVLPLFYTIKPLTDPALRLRLLSLATRAGATVLGVYEWGLGGTTRKANAALTGFGATRRILVSDTMLADYSDEEIEVVLAHELAHHIHGDLWKGLVFEGGLTMAGLFVGAQVLDRVGPLAGVAGRGDIAGLPLLVLSVVAVALAVVPAAHAISRAHERRADRFALDLTGNPTAFVSVMRRLGQQNLAEHQPSRLVRWLFYSHPPLSERIAAAHAYRRETVTSSRKLNAMAVGE